MNWLVLTLHNAVAMLWMTFWALVLGFSISAALQVFVSKEQMSRAFGRANLKTVGAAMGLGAASSSCSYAAAAAGRSAIKQGAAIVPALAFMFASTNLVIEMGIVLYLLMGWPFVLAEFLGAFVLVGVVWLFVRLFLPKPVEREMIENAGAADEDHCCHHSDHEHDHEHEHESGSKSRQLASAFLMDWQMLWKEILGGFLIAGFLTAVVPADWWRALFIETGSTPLRLIENAVVGPLIAIASFVCSVGNIPLAQLLWSNGISFGGVISFIYADLLVVPLILIYAKYYGARATVYIVAIFYAAMVISGIVVDVIFGAVGIIPTGERPPNAMMHGMITWNYTSWLDIAAAIVFALMLYLHFRRTTHAKAHEQIPHHSH